MLLDGVKLFLHQSQHQSKKVKNHIDYTFVKKTVDYIGKYPPESYYLLQDTSTPS